uniref:Uncharacterized protein n=1 Tax=viral metagenome TaxID=1070528 RepID=A0A6C0HM80_9ZZZZ
MCYNLITKYNYTTNLINEHFTSNKLNKFKSKLHINSEKFDNLDVKLKTRKTNSNTNSNTNKINTKRKHTEKFDDVTNKGLLDSALKIFKSKNNKSNKSNKSNNNNNYTIDEVIDRSEKLHSGIGILTIDNLKEQSINYYKSFKKEKFKASSGSTAEALDKFKLFKEKFFDIFK